MSWCRAVWVEGKREEEGVIPTKWIQDNAVRWPKVTNAKRFLQDQAEPSDTWWKFALVKVKYTSGMCVYNLFCAKKFSINCRLAFCSSRVVV